MAFVIPPRLASVHAAVLPILAGSEADNEAVLRGCTRISHEYFPGNQSIRKRGKGESYPALQSSRTHRCVRGSAGNLTVRVDCRKDARRATRHFIRSKSSTPVRIELGARDLAEGIR